MGTSANAVFARSQSAPESGRTSRARHIVALAYLRTFAVILVLAHHTSLAYFPKVPLTRTSLLVQPRLWKAFPILDSHRWTGFADVCRIQRYVLHVAAVFSLRLVRVEQPGAQRHADLYARSHAEACAAIHLRHGDRRTARLLSGVRHQECRPERGGLLAAMAVTWRMAHGSRMVHLGVAGVRLRCCRALREVAEIWRAAWTVSVECESSSGAILSAAHWNVCAGIHSDGHPAWARIPGPPSARFNSRTAAFFTTRSIFSWVSA